MRISDWSSDVCSSDLRPKAGQSAPSDPSSNRAAAPDAAPPDTPARPPPPSPPPQPARNSSAAQSAGPRADSRGRPCRPAEPDTALIPPNPYGPPPVNFSHAGDRINLHIPGQDIENLRHNATVKV